MKIKSLLFATIFAGTIVSCSESESDEFCGNPGATCPDLTEIEAESCCTDQNCYWTYNETQYPCNGDDCEDAINNIIADACASATATTLLKSSDGTKLKLEEVKAKMLAFNKQLLQEARSAAICE
nr:hypothetical protein [uncultured Carboxylicivirga sp.]